MNGVSNPIASELPTGVSTPKTPPSAMTGSNTNTVDKEVNDEESKPSLNLNNIQSATAFGRHKELPKCDASLEKEHKTAKQLSEFVFPRMTAETTTVPATVSSSSSASSAEQHPSDNHDDIVRKVKQRTESRQGREAQRWETEPGTGRRIRLVTGCVPILKGGRILFVSSNNKPEWILPKGGWETDEKMEESAIREAFEEAGVFGTLGPRLTEIQYETRKSKKRRKELEELLTKKDAEDHYQPKEKVQKAQISVSSPTAADNSSLSPRPRAPQVDLKTPDQSALVPDSVFDRIRGTSGKKDDTSSIACSSTTSESTKYSLVKLTLFPLYVSEVWDTWPEDTRYRKEVHIDEAIDITREEFREALVELKEKKLYDFPEPKR